MAGMKIFKMQMHVAKLWDGKIWVKTPHLENGPGYIPVNGWLFFFKRSFVVELRLVKKSHQNPWDAGNDANLPETRQFLNTNTINIFLFILIESIHLQNRHETCFHLPSCLSPLVATSRSKRIMEPWPIEQGLSNRAIFGCLFRRSCQNSFGIKFTSSSLTSKINASSFPSVYCVPLL